MSWKIELRNFPRKQQKKKKKKANDTWLMDMYQIISFPKGGKTNKKSIIFEEIMEIDFLFW